MPTTDRRAGFNRFNGPGSWHFLPQTAILWLPVRHFGASLLVSSFRDDCAFLWAKKKKEAGVKQLLLWSMPLMTATMMMMKDLVNE
jgi:hypothetical protein